MKTALSGLEGIETVEHKAGTDVFVVKHHGQLNATAQAVDRVVILHWARRWLEKLGHWFSTAKQRRR